MATEPLADRIEAATLVDEVGLESGRYGPCLLKTLYQPIFRNTPDGLVPCAVSGAGEPWREGQPVSMHAFRARVATEDRGFVESLCRMLHLRNHDNIGVDGLTLFLDCDPQVFEEADHGGDAVEALLGCLDAADFDPSLLVCEIPDSGEAGVRTSLISALRQRGIRVAMGDFGMNQASLSQIKLLDPEIVKLEGALFRRIASITMAARLLALLIDALQREGRQVLVTGIQKPEHLRVALDSGADFLQGGLLARPKLVGTLFDTTTLQPAKLLATDDKVIPLFSNHPKAR